MSEDRNRIECQWTEKDLVEFNFNFGLSTAFYKKQQIIVQLIILVIAVPSLIFHFSSQSYLDSAITILVAIAWFILIPYLLRYFIRKNCRKLVAETIGDSLGQPHVIELLPDGILSSSQIGELKFPYSSIDRVVENNDYTFIYVGKTMGLILPHDRIPSETIQWWVNEIERKKNEPN